MKKCFLTYDDERGHFDNLRAQLLASVREHSDFETLSFKKSNIDVDFLEKNQHIFKISVGDGVWLWKPYIILKTLEKMDDGDLLFYMDSSYYFTRPFADLYSSLIAERDFVIGKNKPGETPYPMWHLCHKHVIEKYGMLEKLYGNDDNKEPWAGAILIRKNSSTVSLISEWLEMCQVKQDIWGTEQETHRVQHRNDQSLLGILLYKYDIKMEFFETHFLQNVRRPW